MRRNTVMLGLFFSAVLATASSWAAQGGQPIAGMVESRTAQQLKVRTHEGRVISIQLTKETKYLKRDGAGALSELKAGMHVVDAQRAGRRWVARSIRIQRPSPAASTRAAPPGPSHAGMHGEHAAAPAPG